MPVTPVQFIQILVSRNIGVRPVLVPGQPVRWKAGTYDQTHAEGRAHKGTFRSPEEAVEAADLALAAADASRASTAAERLLSSLDDGEHYLKPREVDVPSDLPGGPPGKKTVWDVVDTKTGVAVSDLAESASPRAAMIALADKKMRAAQTAGGLKK